jgi:pimeloyl-ACP methyl ester carboxylesterase
MQFSAPFFREAGAGPGVVCLHSNASNCGQWRALMDELAPRFHVLAADSYGAGKSPPWPADRTLWLRDEAQLLEPVFAAAGDPCSLVGHSYGAAIALVAAVAQPQRFRSLVLYEPTLFSLVDAQSPPPNDADGIRDAVARASVALDAGDAGKAAEAFIDFWMGEGAWTGMPEPRKVPIAASIGNVRQWARVLTREPTPLQQFTQIDIPVLYLIGRDSPASSLSVARLLTAVLPRVEVIEFEGLGHMGPITHPQVVNPAIAGFLERNSR